MSGLDDLGARAKERAESGGVDKSWGMLVELDEEEDFEGRHRGSTTDPKYGRTLWLFWDTSGEPCWMRSYAALDREMDAAAPSVGDRIVVHRGPNYKTAYDEGEPKGRSFGVACEPSDGPPPQCAAAGEPSDGPLPGCAAAGANDLPF